MQMSLAGRYQRYGPGAFIPPPPVPAGPHCAFARLAHVWDPCSKASISSKPGTQSQSPTDAKGNTAQLSYGEPTIINS